MSHKRLPQDRLAPLEQDSAVPHSSGSRALLQRSLRGLPLALQQRLVQPPTSNTLPIRQVQQRTGAPAQLQGDQDGPSPAEPRVRPLPTRLW
jgi:hypothetical protein